MEFDVKKLNIKIRGNEKKEILKIFSITILINILIIILLVLFSNIEILKTIILYVISLFYISINIYIIKKHYKMETNKIKKDFENKYDPILTKFILKNEFILDNELLNAEIYYFIKKGYIEIDKEKNILRLKNRDQFKQIDALEKINEEKIKEYSTEEIPSYENMFIGKILFAFHNEIEIDEFKRNQKNNYYLQRGEICKLAMEKMILYEIEKNNMLEKNRKMNIIVILGILNIITSIILFIVITRFNILLLIATIVNIIANVIIIKNENILSYQYSEEVRNYIDNLIEYIHKLKKEEKNTDDEQLKYLFGIKSIEDLFIQ